jgi:PAS domain S-box-containing protein
VATTPEPPDSPRRPADDPAITSALVEALLDEAPIGVGFIDTNLRYVLVNDRLAQINGVGAGAHIGRTVHDVLGDLAADIEPRLRNVMTTRRRTERIEISGRLPGETESRTWEQSLFPIVTGGRVIGAGVIVEDVTERRRSRDELRRVYAREREIADRFQAGLRPRPLPDPSGYDLVTRYAAGSSVLLVGGDWYDAFEVVPDRYVLAIGDVVGHGIDAALTMARVRYGLSGLAHAIADPGLLLDRLDDFVTPDGDRFVATVFLAMLEPSTGVIRFGSAGHPPPLVIRADGSVHPLRAGRSTPLGITETPQPTATATLGIGDTLMMYTDGLIERKGETIDGGIARLAALASHGDDDLDRLAQHLMEQAPDPERPDDIALLMLRRRAQ